MANRQQPEKINSEAWDLLHQRFDVDTETVASALVDAVKQSAVVISPLNLNSTVRLLREPGFSDHADEVLEMYIEARRGTPEIFHVTRAERMGDIDGPKNRKRFAEE